MKKLTYILLVGLLLACTLEENNTSGTEVKPGNGKDNTVRVTGISLDRSSMAIKEGESFILVATVTPENASNKAVLWSTSCSVVADVAFDGEVIGYRAGIVTITATSEDGGMKATCVVTVGSFALVPVDLGLPSGLKWANCNLGASYLEDSGDHYAWGEVEPYYSSLDPLTWKDGKTGYNWESYKWGNGSEGTLIKYNTDRDKGSVDNKTVLDPEDDAAHVNLGGKWRMPTKEDWDELKEHCTWYWRTENGVDGRLVTGKNGNSIFLPAAGIRLHAYISNVNWVGYYLSSSLPSNAPLTMWNVILDYDKVFIGYGYERYKGLTVRPVYAE